LPEKLCRLKHAQQINGREGETATLLSTGLFTLNLSVAVSPHVNAAVRRLSWSILSNLAASEPSAVFETLNASLSFIPLTSTTLSQFSSIEALVAFCPKVVNDKTIKKIGAAIK
jgi:hypothetical protein